MYYSTMIEIKHQALAYLGSMRVVHCSATVVFTFALASLPG